MKAFGLFAVAVTALATLPSFAAGGTADKMYVLDCGWAHAADKSRWSPGIDVGVPMDVSDNCYLIHDSQGWFLWDTGVAENIADMPDGLSQMNGAVVWHKPKKLADQLAEIKIKPEDVKFLAISHMHADHSSNVDMFPKTSLLIQKAEWEAIFAGKNPPFQADHPAIALEGEDMDVFGDGAITIISTPGHTPGHQSLLVHLKKTGWLVLSGDAVHFKSNWDNRLVPGANFDKDQTVASMDHIAALMKQHNAQLWINHDKEQSATLKYSPAFYE